MAATAFTLVDYRESCGFVTRLRGKYFQKHLERADVRISIMIFSTDIIFNNK